MKDTNKILFLDENVKRVKLSVFLLKIFMLACLSFLTAAGLFSVFAYTTACIIYERIDNVNPAYFMVPALVVIGIWIIKKR
jgi:uncharacterized membrane protein